jgi:hypothetical protein
VVPPIVEMHKPLNETFPFSFLQTIAPSLLNINEVGEKALKSRSKWRSFIDRIYALYMANARSNSYITAPLHSTLKEGKKYLIHHARPHLKRKMGIKFSYPKTYSLSLRKVIIAFMTDVDDHISQMEKTVASFDDEEIHQAFPETIETLSKKQQKKLKKQQLKRELQERKEEEEKQSQEQLKLKRQQEKEMRQRRQDIAAEFRKNSQKDEVMKRLMTSDSFPICSMPLPKSNDYVIMYMGKSIKSSTIKVICTMFNSGIYKNSGIVKWAEFEKAFTDLYKDSKIKSGKGSAFSFSTGKYKMVVHRPHPGGEIHKILARMVKSKMIYDLGFDQKKVQLQSK